MTERTISLDPHEPWSRTIRVRAYRWYANVGLDRDDYVDALAARGGSPKLPAAYTEAIARARDSSFDRIWYDGYPGSFASNEGFRWISLPVPFAQVDAAVEALRSAELDRDYGGLHALADQLALPVEDWLAPGERELVRGVDFSPPPKVFLDFLRAKADDLGLRLNGRATRGSVWIRPTLPPDEKQLRERFPERYPGWGDRWTGYVDPEDAPFRPWVGSRERDLSRGAVPVQLQRLQKPSGGECPCGMSLQDPGGGRDKHPTHHSKWAIGIRPPRNLQWRGSNLALVTTESPIGWRKLVYEVGRMPQRENHYDFNSWSHLGEPERTRDNVRAYLLKADGYIIGYLAAHDVSQHRHWDLDGSDYGAQDDTLRPRIDLIWVASSYRGKGVGATLVQALADDFGCQPADVSWSTPISDAGRRLARRISPEGIWFS